MLRIFDYVISFEEKVFRFIVFQEDFVYIPAISFTFFLRSSSTIAEQPHPPTQSLCVSHFRSIIHPEPSTLNTLKRGHHVTKNRGREPRNHQRNARTIISKGGEKNFSRMSKRGEGRKKKKENDIYMKTYSIRSPQDRRANARH